MHEDIRETAITLNGTRFAYTITAGEDPPVLFLHGWTCNRTFWKHQIEFFASKRKVIAVDFRGHGQSRITAEGNTICQFTDDVHALITGLGLQKIVLAGHSMGGMVAQQFCVDHIDCLKALVLVTTIAADLEDKLISKSIEADTRKEGYRQAFLKHFDGWMDPDTDPKIVERTRDKMLGTSEAVAIGLVRSYRRFDLRRYLPEIAVPTLVIGAGSDASAVPEESKTLVALLPRAKLVMIEKCGHFPMLEQPEKLNQELEAFLAANAG